MITFTLQYVCQTGVTFDEQYDQPWMIKTNKQLNHEVHLVSKIQRKSHNPLKPTQQLTTTTQSKHHLLNPHNTIHHAPTETYIHETPQKLQTAT